MSVTVKNVIDSIRAIAEAQPHKVYDRPGYDEEPNGGDCLYIHGTEGGCIVGVACVKNGASLADLRAYDEGDGTNGQTVVRELFGSMTEAQGKWIDKVQRSQDAGAEWASAVAEADEEFGVQ